MILCKEFICSFFVGASTQISFIAPNATDDRFTLNLFDTDYDIYSHSYLCYGTEQMRFVYLGRLAHEVNGSLSIDDPCLQTGYVQNYTYNNLFGTPCARNQYASLPDLNPSTVFSFMYVYLFNISFKNF